MKPDGARQVRSRRGTGRGVVPCVLGTSRRRLRATVYGNMARYLPQDIVGRTAVRSHAAPGDTETSSVSKREYRMVGRSHTTHSRSSGELSLKPPGAMRQYVCKANRAPSSALIDRCLCSIPGSSSQIADGRRSEREAHSRVPRGGATKTAVHSEAVSGERARV